MSKILIDEGALKLALKKIKTARDCHPNAIDTLLFEAEEILEEALAEQPTQQEPVAWRWSESNGQRWFNWTTDWSHHDKAKSMGVPIEYAYISHQHSASWVGLTQEEFRDFASTFEYGTGGLIRAIEDKLKEKNT